MNRIAMLGLLMSFTFPCLKASARPSEQSLFLMKCWTNEGRTLWGSFGFLDRSRTKFPTELVVFDGTDLKLRTVYDSVSEALKVKIDATPGKIQMTFDTHQGANVIEVSAASGGSTFMGQWTLGEQKQSAYCTVY